MQCQFQVLNWAEYYQFICGNELRHEDAPVTVLAPS